MVGALAVFALLVLASPAGAAPLVVSLTFDDGAASEYNARPLLAARGLRATFYVNTGWTGTNGFMTWDQLAGLKADGNEIGGHTLTHPNLNNLSDAEQQRQVCDDRRNLYDHGLEPKSFAYPYGAYQQNTIDIVKACGYNSARRSGALRPPFAEVIPPGDPYQIRAVAQDRSHTLADMQRWVTDAETTGGWLPLLFHRVCDACDSAGYDIKPELLAQFLDWLKARQSSGTVVKTVDQVIGGPLTPPPGGTPPPPPPDTTAPTVAITAPADGASFSRGTRIRVAATASDTGGSGVASVRFYDEGQLLATDTGAPYETTWNTRKEFRGTHSLTAVATDRAGNVSPAGAVSVTIR